MNPNEEHEKHRWENEGGPAILDPASEPEEEDQGSLNDFDEEEEEDFEWFEDDYDFDEDDPDLENDFDDEDY